MATAESSKFAGILSAALSHISSALKMGGIYVKDGRYIRKVSPEQRNGGRKEQGRVGSEKSVLELRVW